jgi:hypothetical protein
MVQTENVSALVSIKWQFVAPSAITASSRG